jgi:hypothetical protein
MRGVGPLLADGQQQPLLQFELLAATTPGQRQRLGHQHAASLIGSSQPCLG